jgi:hypothetical protein
MGGDVFVFPKMKDANGNAAQAKLEALMLDPATQIAFNTKKGSVPARTDLDVSSMDAWAQKGAALLKEPKKQLPSITYLISPDETGALDDVITQYLNTPSETPTISSPSLPPPSKPRSNTMIPAAVSRGRRQTNIEENARVSTHRRVRSIAGGRTLAPTAARHARPPSCRHHCCRHLYRRDDLDRAPRLQQFENATGLRLYRPAAVRTALVQTA